MVQALARPRLGARGEYGCGHTRLDRPGRRRCLEGTQRNSGPDASGPAAGEAAALERWSAFCDDDLIRYDAERDRPDLDTTSRMSVYLKFGNIHPRTMLADLAAAQPRRRTVSSAGGVARLLRRHPVPASRQCAPQLRRKFDAMRHDTGRDADAMFAAWCEGRTGFPIVDAGCGQWCPRGGCTTACG